MASKNSKARSASRKGGRPVSRSNKTNLSDKKKSYNQTFAIITFAFSIVLFCLIVIPGDHFWNLIHNFIWGLFGNAAVLWSILLIYISIVTSKNDSDKNNNVMTKIYLSIVLIIFLCTLFFVFSTKDYNHSYWSELRSLYDLASDSSKGILYRGAGLFSGVLGIPLVYAFGALGSRIVTITLIFIFVMLLTGTTLIQFFKFLFRPFLSNKDNEYERIQEKNVRPSSSNKSEIPKVSKERVSKRKKAKIDIPIDENLPEHPVKSIVNEDQLRCKTPKTSKSKKQDDFDLMEDNSADIAAKAFIKKCQRNVDKNSSDSYSVRDSESKFENSKYLCPPMSLLEKSEEIDTKNVENELKTSGQLLVDTLKNFNVETRIINISRGPAVTRYELQPAAGVKISKITNLADDIALNLASSGVRIEAPIPGKAAVGVEVPNKVVNVVRMRELLDSSKFYNSKSKLTVVLGMDIAGNVSVADLGKMPHLLIAGSTGSGKSVCINSFIISLLYKSSPDEVRLLMIDPKVVELGVYNGIPHLLVPVVTDPRKAAGSLNWAVNEMLKRYKIFADNNVRDLVSYNKMVNRSKKNNEKCVDKDGNELEFMPQIVIIIDELADLMMAAPNEVEDSICRLAQMARAAGMHLVIATQRPSVDVITGIIKANIPSRIALAVSSQVDSRTILDMSGAEKLLGRGDMLFSPIGSSKPIRIQGCYVADNEISSVINFIKNSQEVEYDENVIEEIEKNAIAEKDAKEDIDENSDPMLNEAIKCVVEAGQASTSLLQRRLRLGYARAGRLIDVMEQMGIVGPHEGSKPRQLLITHQQFLEMNMQKSDEK